MRYFTPDYTTDFKENLVQDETYSARHIHLRAGQEVPEHSAKAIETVILLDGEIDFTASDKTVRMDPGGFVVLEVGGHHALSAVQESQVLVILHRS